MRGTIILVLLLGCYRATPPAGAPCPDDICPDGLVCSPATRTCEVEAVEVDAGTTPPPDATPAVRYRRRIAIYNGSPVALPAGFTLRVALPAMPAMVAQSKVKADLSNLRVIGDGAIGERDRIIDPATATAPATISFSLQAPITPGTINTDYALYYGGADATAALARGSAVFPIFDNFATGLSSIWLRNDGPAIVGGKLVLRAGHTDALTTSAATDGLPTLSALEISARVVDPTSAPTPQNGETFYFWFGYQHAGDFTPTQPWALWVSRGKGQIRGEQKSPVGCESSCEGPTTTLDNTTHYYMIERDAIETRFYLDGVLSYSADVLNTTDYAVMVRNYLATSDVQIDWIRARARVSPDPTVSLATEETL